MNTPSYVSSYPLLFLLPPCLAFFFPACLSLLQIPFRFSCPPKFSFSLSSHSHAYSFILLFLHNLSFFLVSRFPSPRFSPFLLPLPSLFPPYHLPVSSVLLYPFTKTSFSSFLYFFSLTSPSLWASCALSSSSTTHSPLLSPTFYSPLPSIPPSPFTFFPISLLPASFPLGSAQPVVPLYLLGPVCERWSWQRQLENTRWVLHRPLTDWLTDWLDTASALENHSLPDQNEWVDDDGCVRGWRSVIAGLMGRIMHDFVWGCVVTWFYLSPLILQIRKPQPNYPFCLLFLTFYLSPLLCPSPGKLLFSVSFLVFLLMLILLGKGFTVTRWGGCIFCSFFVCVHGCA